MQHDAPTLPAPGEPAGHDRAELLRDWLTIWQSEFAALALDRELEEVRRALLAVPAGQA